MVIPVTTAPIIAYGSQRRRREPSMLVMSFRFIANTSDPCTPTNCPSRIATTFKWNCRPLFVVTITYASGFMVEAACCSVMGALSDIVEQARRLAMQTAQMDARTQCMKRDRIVESAIVANRSATQLRRGPYGR